MVGDNTRVQDNVDVALRLDVVVDLSVERNFASFSGTLIQEDTSDKRVLGCICINIGLLIHVSKKRNQNKKEKRWNSIINIK